MKIALVSQEYPPQTGRGGIGTQTFLKAKRLFTYNKKIIAVSGDRKIDAFMEAVGLGEWVLDSREAHRTTELLKKIEDQKLDVSLLENIRSKNSQIANQVNKILHDIKD